MVIRMNLLVAPQLLTQNLPRAIRQHLIRVHVQAHTRARLKHIHNKVLMVLPIEHLLRRLRNRLPLLRSNQPKLSIRLSRRQLDHRQRPNQKPVRPQSADRKISNRAGRLRSVKRFGRNFNST